MCRIIFVLGDEGTSCHFGTVAINKFWNINILVLWEFRELCKKFGKVESRIFFIVCDVSLISRQTGCDQNTADYSWLIGSAR